jgi:N-acetylglucosaminyldiphosphoundecaprenol N-acetyl-beta-D-mannosaminyltransferase
VTPEAPLSFETVSVLGYPLARCTLEQAATWCLAAALEPGAKLVVTLNPEIIVQAERDPLLKTALQSAQLIVADGVGVVWAARQFGYALPERVPGIELATKLLERGGTDLSVYFLGAKPGVAERAAERALERYGTAVAGTHHGYWRPEETGEVLARVRKSGAQLLLAGLGEGQERFLHEHREALGARVMIGVGGTLDVLAGEVKRTPAWTHKLGLEWAYRVGLDRKRWHRFPRLIAFVRLVRARRRTTRGT